MRSGFSMMAAFAALFGLAGNANAWTRLPDGLYAIEAMYEVNWSSASKWGGCMIVSNRGQDRVPSLYHWGGPFNGNGECGLTNDRQAMVRNAQAVWRVSTVVGGDGRMAYVIKSHVNGRCLIRGEGGIATSPSLHLWTEFPDGDARYCGFRTADDLLRNGQAAWITAAFPYGVNHTGAVVKSLRTTHPIPGFLAFASLPDLWPNLFDRTVHAAFSNTATPWYFDFVRLDG